MIRRPPRSTLFPYNDALPISGGTIRIGSREQHDHVGATGERRPRLHAVDAVAALGRRRGRRSDRKSTRLNSSHANISYAVFCLKKKNINSQKLNILYYEGLLT